MLRLRVGLEKEVVIWEEIQDLFILVGLLASRGRANGLVALPRGPQTIARCSVYLALHIFVDSSLAA